MNCKDTLNWLDAYIDGETDLSQQLEIEQHVKGCSACSARLSERRALVGMVQSASLRAVPSDALEQRLRHVLTAYASDNASVKLPSFSWREWWNGFLSAAVLATATFLAVPNIASLFQDNRFSQEIMNDHVRALMTNHLTDIEHSNQHVVKPWFNGRIDFAPSVSDFSEQGFPLAGGRVDYVDHRAVAVLVYHRALHPIQLFTWPTKSTSNTAMKQFTRNGYQLFHWSQRGMTYWVISDLNARELKDFAELVRSQQ